MAGATMSAYVGVAFAASVMMAAVACPAAAQTFPDEVELSRVTPQAARVASQVAPSVVQVVANIYGTDRVSGVQSVQRLVGAGTIVDQAGYILTSASLVDQAMQVGVVLPGAGSDAGNAAVQMVPADLVGVVADLDLAVIHIDTSGLQALPLARRPIHKDDRTITVLPGASGTHGVAPGIVLATGAPLREDSPVPYLVTDAAEGVVGAPVVNMDGELVGLAAAFVEQEGTTASATAALPAALLDAALTQARSSAPRQRGVVGLVANRVTRADDEGGLRTRAQLVVSDVAAGLPADRAGVRAGDVIVAVDHQPVEGMDLSTLYLALYTLREGQALTLAVDRDGRTLELTPTAMSVVDLLASR